MNKCCFPRCDQGSSDGGSIRGQPGIRFCAKHFAEMAAMPSLVRDQAAFVSALAAAMPVLHKNAHAIAALDEALMRETRRLVALQARRIQNVKISGFPEIDEGTQQ